MPEPAKRSRPGASAKVQSVVEPASPEPIADISADLSYREAQAALELCLAQLQSSDLDIEAMSGLYERAQS
jgi:exodeoxyribonuclease VII small subunit